MTMSMNKLSLTKFYMYTIYLKTLKQDFMTPTGQR